MIPLLILSIHDVVIVFPSSYFLWLKTLPTITLLESYFNSESTYGSTNFEISESQQTEVVLEILKYAGLVIRDPQVIQVASQELQQEEINSKR